MRTIAAFCFAIILAAMLAETRPALAGDSGTIAACLKAERGAGRGGQACVGRISKPCMKEPGGETTAGMKMCTGRELKTWDALLNAEYRRLLGGLEAKSQEKIRAAQRAWIAMRDGDCALPYDTFAGGTLAGVVAGSCLLDHTATRALQLRDLRETNDLQ